SERPPLFITRQPAARVFEKELLPRMLRIECKCDAFIPGQPRKNEELSTRRFKMRRVSVAKEIQRLSQRRAPLLVPSCFATRVTTAIPNPTINAVQATPRCAFTIQTIVDLNFECGRIFVQNL